MGSAHHALKWLELEQILIYPTTWFFLENEGGTIVDHRDDVYSPIREVGRHKMRGGHINMYIDGKHHHDMYIGVQFKCEKLHVLSPF